MPRVAPPREARRVRAAAACLLLTVILAAAACGPPQGAGPHASPDPAAAAPTVSAEPVTQPASSAPPRPRVVLILLENHELSQIIGNACCPYLTALAKRGTLFTDYTAITHPSLPNYLSLTSGGPQGKTGTDDTNPIVDVRNIFAQLSAHGVSWRAYEQSMPRPCFRGAYAGTAPGLYGLKHDPAMMYRDVSGSRLCRFAIPWKGVPSALPRFSFITPNQCNDMHSCAPSVADGWLKRVVPGLLRRIGPDGRILITWDEGITNVGGGGRVATILLGPGVPHSRVRTRLNHYSLLAALETLFGLRRLDHARGARPLPLFLP